MFKEMQKHWMGGMQNNHTNNYTATQNDGEKKQNTK